MYNDWKGIVGQGKGPRKVHKEEDDVQARKEKCTCEKRGQREARNQHKKIEHTRDGGKMNFKECK